MTNDPGGYNPVSYTHLELKCSTMAFLEGLGAFAGKDLEEEGIAIRQRHHEHRCLSLLPAIDDRRLAKIDLGLASPVRQRHEDFR